MEIFQINSRNVQIIQNLALAYKSPEQGLNEYDYLKVLKLLLHLRHDLLQCLISEQLCIPTILGVGPKMYESMNVPEHITLNYTPDIYYFYKGNHYFIDPGISTDPITQSEEKTKKYLPGITYLRSLGYNAEFIPICVRPELHDIDTVIKNPIPWPPPETLMLQFQDIYDIIADVISEYKPLCPKNDTYEDMSQMFTDFLSTDTLRELQSRTETGRHFIDKEYMDYDKFQNIFYDLVEDPDISDIIMDKPIDKEHYYDMFTKSIGRADHDDQHVKPSFHIPYAPDMQLEMKCDVSGIRKNQVNALNVLSHFLDLPDDNITILLKQIYNESIIALSHEGDKNMFDTDCYTGDYDKEFKFKESKPPNVPFRDYLISKGYDLATSKPRILKGRLFNINLPKYERDFLYHSGVNYIKHNFSRKYKAPRDCPSDSQQVFQDFYNKVSDSVLKPTKPDDIMMKPPGFDSDTSNSIKINALEQYYDFHNCISRTHAYRMAMHSSIIAKALIHFNNMNTKENDFTLINGGFRNICHIMQGGKRNKGNDVGNPFFTIVITDDKFWCNRVFGSHTVYTVGKLYYCVYHWRRLSSNRLSFIADSFLSCQSTGFDTYMRQSKKYIGREELKRIYTFRTLVSQCTTQRLAEVLMDIRYLCMSFISDFSDVAGLISEKFGPRYPNMFTYWVVASLRDKVQNLIEDYNTPGNIIKKIAIYSQETRQQESTGGEISIMSLWSDSRLHSLQDLLDELFVYCHTMKEPSSVFHEFKKCFKTIVDYQVSFDQMNSCERLGEFNSKEEIKMWLMKIKTKVIKPMGCWNTACFYSARCSDLPSNDKLFNSDLKRNINCEPLSSIISTKACIPEYKTSDAPYTTKDKKVAHLESLKEFLKKSGANPEEYNALIRKLGEVAIGSVIIPEKVSGRMKVIDCIQDFLIRYPSTQTVLEVANWNMKENNLSVIADVCIKAQYGAKREFYVMNLGAKCMLRVMENTFKVIAQRMPEEMISVPGDTKLKHMNRVTDLAIKWSPETKYKLFFTNGDCSKWSASEVMASFMGLLDGLRGTLPEENIEYCKTVVSAWSDKFINIPIEMIKGTKFVTDENNYMKNGNKLHSTQNFLQGMMNYTSSVKAILATRLAIKLWNNKISNPKIFVEQLGHSDDYMLIIRSPDTETMLKFRNYHKLMQRLVGITDSTKKTNIQRHVMEFISLLSFNGQMAYPNIKKTKETGLNIGCEGYQNDIMNAVSRVGESVRLGVPLITAYIQQRLHCISIYRAYTLAEGMRNEVPASKDPFNWPIELFGLPDCLPLLYINSYCDTNNVRLYKYNQIMRMKLNALFEIGTLDKEYDIYEPLSCPILYRPTYKYRKAGGIIKKIRDKIGKKWQDIVDYNENYPEYKIMKPNNPILLQHWIQNLYYNNSFSKAYTVVSRPNLLLRLSYFCSNACCTVPWADKPQRIKEFNNQLLNRIDSYIRTSPRMKELDILNHLASYNINVLTMFSIIEGTSLTKTSFTPQNPQAMHLPKPIKHTRLQNNLSDIIQLSLSEERFKLDGRTIKSPGALRSDIKSIETIIGKSLKELESSDMIKIHSLMRSQTTQSKYGIGFSGFSDKSILIYVISWLTNGIDPKNRFYVITEKSIEVENPITGEMLFERDFGMHTYFNNIFIENLTQWFYFLVAKHKWNRDEFVKLFNGLKTQKSNPRTLLLDTPIDYSDTRDIIHKRMFAFFRYYIFGVSEDLIEMTTNSLSYKYSFLSKKEAIERRKTIPNFSDGVQIRHQEINYLVYCLDGRNDFYIQTSNVQLTKIAYIYTVGQFLMKKISAEEQTRRMTFGLINEIQTHMGGNEQGFVKMGKNIIYKTNTSGMCTLNIILRDPGYFNPREKNVGGFQNFKINEGSASVQCSGVQIFKLSLLACGQQSVISDISGEVDGLDLKMFLKDNLIYWYLRNQSVASLVDIELTKKVRQFRIPMRKLILNQGYPTQDLKSIFDEAGLQYDTENKFNLITSSNLVKENKEPLGPAELTEEELRFPMSELMGFSLIGDDGHEFKFTGEEGGSKGNKNDTDVPIKDKVKEGVIEKSSEPGIKMGNMFDTIDFNELMNRPRDEEPDDLYDDLVFSDEDEEDENACYEARNQVYETKPPTEIIGSPKLTIFESKMHDMFDKMDFSTLLDKPRDIEPDDLYDDMSDGEDYTDQEFTEPDKLGTKEDDILPIQRPDTTLVYNPQPVTSMTQQINKDSIPSNIKDFLIMPMEYGDIDISLYDDFGDDGEFFADDEFQDAGVKIPDQLYLPKLDKADINPVMQDYNRNLNWGDIGPSTEEMRDLNKFTFEDEEVIEDLDAPDYVVSSDEVSEKSSSDEDIELPFFLTDVKKDFQNVKSGYIDKLVSSLPSVHDYITQQYVGINTNMLLNNTELLFHMIKFCAQSEEMIMNNYKFSEEEIQTIELIGSLITKFASQNCMPGGYNHKGIRISTTENCRIRLEKQLTFNMKNRADMTAKTRKGRVIEDGSKYSVVFWSDKLLKKIFEYPVNVSRYVQTNTFGKIVEDIEMILNDCFQYLDLSDSEEVVNN